MITMSRINHKKPYKVRRVQHESKMSRASFVTTRNGVEMLKVSEYALPDSVGISEESITQGNQIQASPLPIVMNFKAIEH